jgi:hypothetical protein
MKHILEYLNFNPTDDLSIEDMNRLKDLGFMTQGQIDGYKRQVRGRQYLDSDKQIGSGYENTEVDIKINSKLLYETNIHKLTELGLYLVSSNVQLKNGTLMFSFSKYFDRLNDCAIILSVGVASTYTDTPIKFYVHSSLRKSAQAYDESASLIKNFPDTVDMVDSINTMVDYVINHIDLEKTKEYIKLYSDNPVKLQKISFPKK